LIVDDGTTMDGGTVSITGSAEVGDARPEAIQASLVGLGLDAGEFTVDRGSAQVDPVELQAVLDGTSVTFTGTVPDEASLTYLIAAGEAVWGPGSVDVSGVGVGAASWAEARVTLTGVTGPGDQRYEAFPAEIRNRFGNLVEVDVSEVEVDTGSEALAAIETAIADALAAQPITFAPVSADIDSESDEVLSTIAEELMAVPGVAVEVVGHTDDQGDEAENLALSQQRAEAVVARLVELGVDGARLTSRGEGEASPVADNDTAAGRAQNRRIEFLLGGAAN
jgi:outer membrane protein OmpA-like peptidoglycan-associated protein